MNDSLEASILRLYLFDSAFGARRIGVVIVIALRVRLDGASGSAGSRRHITRVYLSLIRISLVKRIARMSNRGSNI